MPTHVRHVFLTGFPGVGKTTTMLAVIEELGKADDALTPEGFYTEEIRDDGGARCGFDVVTFGPDARRGPLARLVTGGDASPRPRDRVGRYAVDVASLEALACPALSGDAGKRLDETPSARASPGKTEAPRRATRFVALDEIGKMECLSARFERAAWETLESPETIVLGTIPARPNDARRDRCALARSVAARSDVAVVRVERTSRDALRAALVDALRRATASAEREDGEGGSVPLAPLAPFLDVTQRPTLGPRRQEEASLETKARLRDAAPCAPLVAGGDAHRRLLAARRVSAAAASFPPPRTLLLGETSSPAPPETRPERAYAERSMWRVLDDALAGLPEVAAARDETDEAIREGGDDGAEEADGAPARRLLTRRLLATFRAGLAVWDVAADVHAPGARRRTPPGGETNDVLGFLRARPSVTTVAFVGERAWRRFRSAPENAGATREDASAKKRSSPARRRWIVVEGRAVAVVVVRSARGDESERLEKVQEWTDALFGEAATRAEPAEEKS